MHRGVAAILGIIGGLLMWAGVFLGIIGQGLQSLIQLNANSFFEVGYDGIIILVLGLLTLIFTGYAQSNPPPDKAVGGVVVLIVAVIAFFFSGKSNWLVLATIGAILAGIGGLIFLLQSAFSPRPMPASP